MEALDMLEKRIDALNSVLGCDRQDSETRGEDLTEALISANTLITSATSGRSQISEVMKRSNELETYLDPSFLDDNQQLKAKEVYINTVANELAQNFETLQKIKQLEPTLGAEYFRNIPDVSGKLKDMNGELSNCKQQNEMIEESLAVAMQRFSEIQNGIQNALKEMTDRIDTIEGKVKNAKKKDVDVETTSSNQEPENPLPLRKQLKNK